jgi:LacI family transcriptional regulator
LSSQRRAPTISEVARAAGVGRATAARTLGQYGYVSEELRNRVISAAQELGYQPNALARSVSTGRSATIGVVVADIANPFFGSFVQSITESSHEAGFSTLLLSTNEHLVEEIDAFQLLINKRVDGILVATSAQNVTETRHIQQAQSSGIPVVLIDRQVPDLDIDSVVISNRETTREAVSQLLALGHTRVGFIWGPKIKHRARYRRELTEAASHDIWTDGQRLLGYFDAYDDLTLPIDPGLVSTGEKTAESVQQEVTHMLKADNRPSAFFCTELEALIGTLRAVADCKLSIPRDVSIIGLDDTPWAEVVEPPLTTIEQPLVELGRTAASLLIQRITNTGQAPEPVKTVLQTRLIHRDSVVAPHQSRESRV